MKPRALQALWIIAATLTVALLGLEIFGSQHFNYQGEAQPLWSLLRMARGASYQGTRLELPVYYNPHTPYFFWSVQPLINLLRPESLEATAMVGRGVIVTCFGLLVWLALRFGSRRLPGFNPALFLCTVAAVVMQFPEMIFLVKPDYASFLAEFVGFWLVAAYLPTSRRALLWGSGFAFAAAVALKPNTVGVAVGVGLFLLWRRQWRTLAVFLAVGLVSVAGFLWLADRLAGDALAIAWHAAFERRPISIGEAVDTVRAIATDIVAFNVPLWMLAYWGLRATRAHRPELASLLTATVLASLGVATLGQFADGAWYNYYFGGFLLAAIPASIGVAEACAIRPVRLALELWLAVVSVHLALSVGITVNANRNYPYREVLAYLDDRHPGGLVYSNDDSALLHLHGRTLTAPWAERYLELVGDFRTDLPALEDAMRAGPGYTAALIPGAQCERWRPDGVFRAQIAHLTRLEARFRKLCLFVPATP